MGRIQLLQLLPSGVTTVGIDEHTALVMDRDQKVLVMGRGRNASQGK